MEENKDIERALSDKIIEIERLMKENGIDNGSISNINSVTESKNVTIIQGIKNSKISL